MDNSATIRHTLSKAERLCSQKAIEALFQGGQKSLAAYPIRVVFMPTEQPVSQILISVSKRHFKQAVKRNLIKRQIREAYREHKHLLSPDSHQNIAFLWLSDDLYPTQVVSEKVKNLLTRIQEHA